MAVEVRRVVRFYEHHGFAVAGHGDAPGGGPHVWFMRLEP